MLIRIHIWTELRFHSNSLYSNKLNKAMQLSSNSTLWISQAPPMVIQEITLKTLALEGGWTPRTMLWAHWVNRILTLAFQTIWPVKAPRSRALFSSSKTPSSSTTCTKTSKTISQGNQVSSWTRRRWCHSLAITRAWLLKLNRASIRTRSQE